MRELNSVELARFVERYIDDRLIGQRECEGTNDRFVPVFTLFEYIRSQEYGTQVTSGFFGKILCDMRKAGIVVAANGGKALAASEEAWQAWQKRKAVARV
jgi:hypothetical protein